MGRKTYEQKLQETTNPLLKKLFQLILEKKSNLCVASNFDSIEETLKFIDQVGEDIVILKVQSQRFDGNRDDLKLLTQKKKQYRFLLFEDQKWHDSAETVHAVYKLKFVDYVDLVTVLPVVGFNDGLFNAIETAVQEANLPDDEPRGCLAVCEESFCNPLPNPLDVLALAQRHNVCVGIIAQGLQVCDANMIKATPGVHISETTDGKNQNWRHPSQVIADGADIVIVGRGIVAAPQEKWKEVCRRYKETSFQAYQQLVTKEGYSSSSSGAN